MELRSKPKSKEIRQRAWDALGAGAYWPFVGGNFVMGMITGFAMMIPTLIVVGAAVGTVVALCGGMSELEKGVPEELAPMILCVIALGTVVLMIPFTYVIGFASWGSSKMSLAAADREFRFGLCVSGWGHGWKMAWTVMVQWTYLTLWFLLLIVPGILKSFSYVLTTYVQIEHPDWGANRCIEESMRLMKGNRWRLFKLGISFIGWWFLLVLLVPFGGSGLGALFLMPYPMTAFAVFYRQLLVEKGPALP